MISRINKRRKTVLYILIALIVLFISISRIHPFLSSNDPVDAEILVYEGWIFDLDNSLQEALEEFRQGNYKHLITIGFSNDYQISGESRSWAFIARQEFIRMGIDPQLVHAVIVPLVQKHRTFSLALGFRIWLEKNKIKAKGVNVFTFGPHARKSEVVFKQALEPKYHVGVISAIPTHYDPRFWWSSWIGFKWVFFDFIKYIRALL